MTPGGLEDEAGEEEMVTLRVARCGLLMHSSSVAAARRCRHWRSILCKSISSRVSTVWRARSDIQNGTIGRQHMSVDVGFSEIKDLSTVALDA